MIGSPRDDGATKESGAVYVFKRGAGWQDASTNQADQLIASNGQRHDRFGRSVSISANTVLVGARLADGSVNNSGAAYVFAEIPTVTIADDEPSPPPWGDDMYVCDIAFKSRTRGKAGSVHDEQIKVTVRFDSDTDGVAEIADDPVPGATVTVELTGPVGGNFSGSTDSAGQFITAWVKDVPDGIYTAEVTALTNGTLGWSQNLDPTTTPTWIPTISRTSSTRFLILPYTSRPLRPLAMQSVTR